MNHFKNRKINIVTIFTIIFWILSVGIVTAENNTTENNITIRGRLLSGVESGCIVLNGDDGKTYQLFNLSNEILPPFGSIVVVNGTIETGIFSYCMQGISVKVSNIHLLNRIKGDVNDDGVVTSTDALLYLRYTLGQDISPYHVDNNDDVTCDNKITITDAIVVLRNLIDVYKCDSVP